jgi:hypothetical protein
MHALRWAREAITFNWPIKLTALILAAVLWAVVAAEAPTTQLIAVPLTITPPRGRSLATPPPAVNVIFAGTARDLLRLYATPPTIQRAIADTVTDSTVVLHLSPDDVVIPSRIDVRAEAMEPRAVTITLAGHRQPPSRTDTTMTERVLMGIPVTVRGPRGRWASEPPAVIVTVRGPSSRLFRLTRDSVAVTALPSGTGRPESVRLEVSAPEGLSAGVTPDTALVRRAGG